MSLVGTRPPTIDEYTQYDPRHKRRLSFRPGITGLWQVSGRSEVKSFHEVVEMDLQYIDRWSIRLDVKILAKTICEVLLRRGAA
jgi:lipopolysaccharide/colanic/teichoic acid biosynthesis glycosyltransferase